MRGGGAACQAVAGLRAICVHGHFYQPPRDDPWLGVIEPQPSAFPDRDWNVRIERECYGPTAAARVLDGQGRLLDVVNCYEWTGFNVGPTLMAWLAAHAPATLAAMRQADERALARTGHGTAWAQPYGHPILPLCSPRDAATQVRWGVADFEARFGRAPEGMWLPEMAVDIPALSALAEAGIVLTLLAPHQARRVRPLGGREADWQPVSAGTLDVRRLYRCRLPGGRSIDIVFREPGISHELSFGSLLADGARLAGRLREAVGVGDDDVLVTASVDGETWGHHHRFGEMALAYALRLLRQDSTVTLLPPAAFRERCPPAYEVQLWERTAWSCAHGIDRWRADCGCQVASPPGWTQAWRAPLRQAIDWLRDELALVYQARASELLRDPWGARDRYIEVVLHPERTMDFVAREATRRLSGRGAIAARRVLEMARHALLMQTSCGWFFDDLSNIETLHNLRHAARAIELAEALGARLENDFVALLDAAESNIREEGSGAQIWRQRVRDPAPRPVRVAATSAMLAMLERPVRLPGYEVQFSSAPAATKDWHATATVVETTTGAAFGVPLLVGRTDDGAAWCEAGGRRYDLRDLFGVQREAVMSSVSREVVQGTRAGRRAVLDRARGLLEPVLADGVIVPRDLGLILGWDEAERILHAVRTGEVESSDLVARTARLSQHGVVFPARWLSEHLTRAIEQDVERLPATGPAILALLDLAQAAGVVVDLGVAQVRALRWWLEAPPEVRTGPTMTRLRERLALAPEIG